MNKLLVSAVALLMSLTSFAADRSLKNVASLHSGSGGSVTVPTSTNANLNYFDVGTSITDLLAAKQETVTWTAADFNYSAPTVSIDYANAQKATGAQPGFLTAADWSTFNGKQAAGDYITALTGDVTASGPGSVAATVATVGGYSAANVAAGATLANAATSSPTASTIVKRDADGFTSSAGVIFNPRFFSYLFDDFSTNNLTTNFSETGWIVSATGSCTATVVAGVTSHPGQIQCDTTTGATNRAGIHHGLSSIQLGEAAHFEFSFQLPILSTSAEEFAFWGGLGDSVTADPLDGIIFRYNRIAVVQATTGTTNGTDQLTSLASTTQAVVGIPITGTNIPAGTTISGISGTTITLSQAASGSTVGGTVNYLQGDYFAWITANNNALTVKVLSGANGEATLPVTAATYYNFQCDGNAGLTSVTCYAGVSGATPTSVGTSITNLPSGAGRQLGPVINIVKSVGTGPRAFIADYWYHWLKLTPR